jgi:aspartyl/asparaginyl beta-hydroxylase (cupin superfamily)
MESSQWENLNRLFCRNVSFLTAPHCQFRDVCQGMKQTYLYLWYPLFQAQWNRSDQQNHQTYKLTNT